MSGSSICLSMSDEEYDQVAKKLAHLEKQRKIADMKKRIAELEELEARDEAHESKRSRLEAPDDAAVGDSKQSPATSVRLNMDDAGSCPIKNPQEGKKVTGQMNLAAAWNKSIVVMDSKDHRILKRVIDPAVNIPFRSSVIHCCQHCKQVFTNKGNLINHEKSKCCTKKADRGDEEEDSDDGRSGNRGSPTRKQFTARYKMNFLMAYQEEAQAEGSKTTFPDFCSSRNVSYSTASKT